MPARVISNCKGHWDVRFGLDFKCAVTNHLKQYTNLKKNIAKTTTTWSDMIQSAQLLGISSFQTPWTNFSGQVTIKCKLQPTPKSLVFWALALATVKTMEHPSRRDSHLSGLWNNDLTACWAEKVVLFLGKYHFTILIHIVSPFKTERLRWNCSQFYLINLHIQNIVCECINSKCSNINDMLLNS